VCSVGSFSKIVSPGLRTAWVHSKGSLNVQLSSTAILVSGGGFCSLEGCFLGDSIQNGSLKQHLNNVIKNYENLASIMETELKKCPGLEFEKANGGFFMWVKLKEMVNVDLFFEELSKNNIIVLQGDICSVSKNYKNYFRLCFAFLSEDEIIQGTQIIKSILQ